MTATFTSIDPESDRCPRCGALLARDIVRLRVQYEALMAAALAAVRGHNIVISNGGTGWSRHVEEPLWQLRKALRVAGLNTGETK